MARWEGRGEETKESSTRGIGANGGEPALVKRALGAERLRVRLPDLCAFHLKG